MTHQIPMRNIAVITINHGHSEMIKKAIESFAALSYTGPCQSFVINNIRDDGIKHWLKDNYPDLTILENSSPQGFAANINRIIEQYPDFDYYLLLNPDVICLPGMLEELIKVMEQDQKIGIAGPKLMNMDGSVQPSRRRFANFWVMIIRALHIDSLIKDLPSIDRYLMSDVVFDAVTEVDWVTGAVMLLRKEALNKVGLFDERFYIYFEDEDLCCRMWQQGWKICYISNSQAYHAHLAEGRKKILSKANLHHITSALKMFIKYHGNIAKRCGRKY